jgi:putative tryptophan/tyrosine transport system substrate-binding protein
MRRREFITLLGGAAAAWPFTVRAQQPAMPMVGFLGAGSAAPDAWRVAAFRQGLNESGYVEGRNLVIEFRWADGDYDRLPQLAAELISRSVAVIFAGQLPATLAAKAATSKIPIIFANGNDPVEFGLVASLSRPGGNITGVSVLVNMLAAKHLELLHEMVPKAVLVGLLVNWGNPNVEVDRRELEAAANVLGQKLVVLEASTPEAIEAAFATLVQKRADALFIHADAFFASRYKQLAALTARYAIPTVFHLRDFVMAGGLMSYGADLADGHRQAGIYAGRILNGEKPADLPVQQSVKVELVINVKTAKSLGLIVPMSLLGRADEMIE